MSSTPSTPATSGTRRPARYPSSTASGVPAAVFATITAATAASCSLHETIQALVTWTEAHQNEIAAARAAYDEQAASEPTPGTAAAAH